MTTQLTDISNVHGGMKIHNKSERLQKRNAAKRKEYYKLLEKRDELLNKLCRVQEQIKSIQKSLAYISAKMGEG